MKVRELIEFLQGVDGESELVLSSDSEGNNFSTAYEVYNAMAYVSEDERDVDIFLTDIDDFEHDEYMTPAVVIFP